LLDILVALLLVLLYRKPVISLNFHGIGGKKECAF
jgi:hypothetical protein